MGSTSAAPQASMRRCPGAAGPQYSMYPRVACVRRRVWEYPFGAKMRLRRQASLPAALSVVPAVRPSLFFCAADPAMWRKGTPQSVSHAK